MGRIRVLGETKLKQDLVCPFCKKIAKNKGSIVEIVQDMNTGQQLAAVTCDFCKENLMVGENGM